MRCVRGENSQPVLTGDRLTATPRSNADGRAGDNGYLYCGAREVQEKDKSYTVVLRGLRTVAKHGRTNSLL